MTIAAQEFSVPTANVSPWTWIWTAALLAVGTLYLFPDIAPWAVDYPVSAVLPVADIIGGIMAWLKTNLTWFTRWITEVLGVPLSWAFNLLSKGWKIGTGADAVVLPRLSWVGICAAFAIMGYAFGGLKLCIVASFGIVCIRSSIGVMT